MANAGNVKSGGWRRFSAGEMVGREEDEEVKVEKEEKSVLGVCMTPLSGERTTKIMHVFSTKTRTGTTTSQYDHPGGSFN